MNWSKGFDRFNFNYNFSINNEIGAETQVQFHVFINYRNRSLNNDLASALSKLVLKYGFVDRFKEPRPQSRMNFECGIDNYTGEFVFSHKNISRKVAKPQSKRLQLL